PPSSPLFPYTTLFRSHGAGDLAGDAGDRVAGVLRALVGLHAELRLRVALVLERRAARGRQVHVEHRLRVVGVAELLVALRHRVEIGRAHAELQSPYDL